MNLLTNGLVNFLSLVDDPRSLRIVAFLYRAINIMKLAVPILLVLMASVDLVKAVVASDEKEMKAAQKLIAKRALYGIAVFFVVSIVQFLFKLYDPNFASYLTTH
jgi:hypothetical protein